jgi:hypothetical protein
MRAGGTGCAQQAVRGSVQELKSVVVLCGILCMLWGVIFEIQVERDVGKDVPAC